MSKGEFLTRFVQDSGKSRDTSAVSRQWTTFTTHFRFYLFKTNPPLRSHEQMISSKHQSTNAWINPWFIVIVFKATLRDLSRLWNKQKKNWFNWQNLLNISTDLCTVPSKCSHDNTINVSKSLLVGHRKGGYSRHVTADDVTIGMGGMSHYFENRQEPPRTYENDGNLLWDHGILLTPSGHSLKLHHNDTLQNTSVVTTFLFHEIIWDFFLNSLI